MPVFRHNSEKTFRAEEETGFTKHCLELMRARDISEEDLATVLKKGFFRDHPKNEAYAVEYLSFEVDRQKRKTFLHRTWRLEKVGSVNRRSRETENFGPNRRVFSQLLHL